MGHPKLESLIYPIRGGTGSASLAPPWSRDQVRWIGRGYFVLRLATEETSRWLLGGGFRWNEVYPHERTFRRSAEDKNTLMKALKMNPWPVHMAAPFESQGFRDLLATQVEGSKPMFDTGHVTLWRIARLPRELPYVNRFVVLDGHHSRKAQRSLGLKRMFGWVEPLGNPQLSVRSIDRAGWLARWLDECIARGELKIRQHAPELSEWTAERSLCFEVVQASRRFWCEVAKPLPGEAVVDALARLGKSRVFFKTSAHFEEIMGWLERLEVDTGLRLPSPTKDYVLDRAVKSALFPQKATYFFPKIPFGVLVEDHK